MKMTDCTIEVSSNHTTGNIMFVVKGNDGHMFTLNLNAEASERIENQLRAARLALASVPCAAAEPSGTSSATQPQPPPSSKPA